MSERSKHVFQFAAEAIAAAARAEAEYHERRLKYWTREFDHSVKVVEATCGAKVVRQPVTGGYRALVVVHYGDPAAYTRMQEADAKMTTHRKAAEEYRVDERVYGTQTRGVRIYDLATDDVHHYRLGQPPRHALGDEEFADDDATY